jgi:hypothetical protein
MLHDSLNKRPTEPESTSQRRHFPRFIAQTKRVTHRSIPMPPDELCREIRTIPTSPDHSDQPRPSHNPSVVSSIPNGPTNWDRSIQKSILHNTTALSDAVGVRRDIGHAPS